MGEYLGEMLSGPVVGQSVWGVLENLWVTANWALSYFSEYFFEAGVWGQINIFGSNLPTQLEFGIMEGMLKCSKDSQKRE